MKKTIRNLAVAAACILTLLSLSGCLSLDFSSSATSSASSSSSSSSAGKTVSLAGRLYDEQDGYLYMEGLGIRFVNSKDCIYATHYEPPYTFVPGTYTVDAQKGTVTATLPGKAYMDKALTTPWESDVEPESYKRYFITRDNFETLIELYDGDPNKEAYEFNRLDISNWE